MTKKKSSASHRGVPNAVSHPKLEDATKPFVFSVDREKHVRGSTVMDVHNCAGARALRDIPGVKDAWVTMTRAFILHEDGRIVRYTAPHKLGNSVRIFDGTGGLFPPGEYRLAPVRKSHRMGARKLTKNAGKNAADRKNPKRKRIHSYTFR